MIISSPIDPPPAYRSVVVGDQQHSSRNAQPPSPPLKGIISLPLGVQLEILQLTLDYRVSAEGDEDAERARRMYDLLVNVRATCRTFYLLCMSMLRSRYLSAYLSQVRVPYTSDPFPVASSSSAGGSLPIYSEQQSLSSSSFYDAYGRPLTRSTVYAQGPHSSSSSSSDHVYRSRGRETAVFDRFICLRVGSDLRRAESDLALDGDEERDLFVRLQPAARLEDLLLQRSFAEAVHKRLVDPPPNPIPDANTVPRLRRIPFDHLSIKFTPPRRVTVNLAIAFEDRGVSWRCLGEYQRSGKDEELEQTVEMIESVLRQVLR